jgi:hypothetical protein
VSAVPPAADMSAASVAAATAIPARAVAITLRLFGPSDTDRRDSLAERRPRGVYQSRTRVPSLVRELRRSAIEDCIHHRRQHRRALARLRQALFQMRIDHGNVARPPERHLSDQAFV